MSYFTSTNITKQKGHKMKVGQRTKYSTMNSWNQQDSLSYDLKIYNVIRSDLRQKAYTVYDDENLSCELYDGVNGLIDDFTHDCNYGYTAGFNGRQGGHLVLYKSCRITDSNGKTRLETYMHGLDEKDVPSKVKILFRKLAQNIVNHAEWFLKNYDIVEQEIMIPKKIKTFEYKGV